MKIMNWIPRCTPARRRRNVKKPKLASAQAACRRAYREAGANSIHAWLGWSLGETNAQRKRHINSRADSAARRRENLLSFALRLECYRASGRSLHTSNSTDGSMRTEFLVGKGRLRVVVTADWHGRLVDLQDLIVFAVARPVRIIGAARITGGCESGPVIHNPVRW